MERKRILQISNYYYPEIGGIENIAGAISEALQTEYEVKVICFTHDRNGKHEIINGVEVIRCGTAVKLFSQQLSMDIVRIIKKNIIEFKPEIVIIHLPNPFLEFVLLKYLPKDTKLIIYWHSDIVKQRLGKVLVSGINDRILKRADMIIATSYNYITGSAELTRYKEKCTVIANCIDENKLIPTSKSKKISSLIKNKNEEKTICLCVGRQVPYKGFEYAIEAIKSLGDEFVLYLVGRSGSSTKLLRKLSNGRNNIKFVGEIDNDKLIGLFEASDIICFPSVTKNEAFGIALAEGMYFNKPSVTFTIPGSGVNYVNLNEITGLEVPNRNIEAFAKAVQKLSEDKKMREELGRNAGNRVRNLFLTKEFRNNIIKAVGEL